jgi:hypothetical protein
MSLIARYESALIGGFLGMFVHVYLLYGRQDWFQLARLNHALGAGLIFGHVAAFAVLAARDLPVLLARKVRKPYAAIAGMVAGTALGALAWWAHAALFLLNSQPEWRVLLFGGLSFAAGFVPAAFWIPRNLALRLLLVLMTTLCFYVPICATFLLFQEDAQANQALLYFRDPVQMFVIAAAFSLLIACCGHLPLFVKYTNHLTES